MALKHLNGWKVLQAFSRLLFDLLQGVVSVQNDWVMVGVCCPWFLSYVKLNWIWTMNNRMFECLRSAVLFLIALKSRETEELKSQNVDYIEIEFGLPLTPLLYNGVCQDLGTGVRIFHCRWSFGDEHSRSPCSDEKWLQSHRRANMLSVVLVLCICFMCLAVWRICVMGDCCVKLSTSNLFHWTGAKVSLDKVRGTCWSRGSAWVIFVLCFHCSVTDKM